VFRAVTLLVASLTGYYFFGFMGFTYGAALSALPPLIYYWRLQQKHKLLTVKYESYKVAFVVGVWICAYASSSLLMALFPHMRLGH
jgi:hypothetical protein